MKKIITIIMLIAATGAKAQFHTGIGAGTDFRFPVACLNLGYEFKGGVMLEGEIQPSITRNVAANNYVSVKLGYSFQLPADNEAGIIPSISYCYNRKSADYTELNGSYVGISMKLYTMINDQGGLFVNTLYVHHTAQLTAGIHFIFQ